MKFKPIKFPDSVIFGASTAAYQIEGAADEDGKGPSIWDVFCNTPGAILNGDTGRVACDFYHRYKEDIRLMKDIGIEMFRFSVSWPRIFPEGFGRVNHKGLDFYHKLVDELLANGIQPFITLNHWDMPQALEKLGGWRDRRIPDYFAEYARIMAELLSDRVKLWTTHNEPHCIAAAGHIYGNFAPGVKGVRNGLQVMHHLNIAHGLATEAIKSTGAKDVKTGAVLGLFPIYPVDSNEADIQAARRWDGFYNRCFLDPIAKGTYPDEMLEYFGDDMPKITQKDMDIIHQPLDLLGVNCYFRRVIRADATNHFIGAAEVRPDGAELTQMGWEVYPPCIYEILTHLHKHYDIPELYIAENGAAFEDVVSDDGRVHDQRRLAYLHAHIQQVARAVEAGVNLRGYLVWSLLDNFEWTLGYARRFGIVYVDYETQHRILKDSGRWYAEQIACNRRSDENGGNHAS